LAARVFSEQLPAKAPPSTLPPSMIYTSIFTFALSNASRQEQDRPDPVFALLSGITGLPGVETDQLYLQEPCSTSARKGEKRMNAEPIERDDMLVHWNLYMFTGNLALLWRRSKTIYVFVKGLR
jgi:hypothetical protein